MAEINLDGHRKYIISLWDQFLKRAKKQCLRCDHYYPLVFTFSNRWVKGHFCLHWPELYHEYKDADYLLKETTEMLTKRNNFNRKGEKGCYLYRDRKSGHICNSLRPIKDYYDFNNPSLYYGDMRKIPKNFTEKKNK